MASFFDEVHKQNNLPLAVDLLAGAALLSFLGSTFEKYRREIYDQSSGVKSSGDTGAGGK
jgi:hypothetical protein